MNRKAIFTILWGEKYLQPWHAHVEAGWRAYAHRHQYDIVVVDHPIGTADHLATHPIHWHKLLIPSLPEAARYDRIVFLDADILINYHRAPCIVASSPPDRIGLVRFDRYVDDAFTYYLAHIRRYKFARYAQRQKQLATQPHAPPLLLTGPDYTTAYQPFTTRTDLPLLNTGVLVFDPKAHGPLLAEIYRASFAELKAGGAQAHIYEQNYVAWKLLQAGIVADLDERFNRIAYLEQAIHYPFLDLQPDPALMRICYSTLLANAWFLHFAANLELMPFAVTNDEHEFAAYGLPDIFKRDREQIPVRRVSAPQRQKTLFAEPGSC